MSGCCESNCNPVLPIDVEPCQEPIDCTPPPACCEHCLLARLLMLYPQFNCNPGDDFRACMALHQAEALVAGILDANKRSMAAMFGALHLLTIEANASARQQAIAASIAFGEKPDLGRSGGEFWDLSDWGAMVKQLLESNARVGFMVI